MIRDAKKDVEKWLKKHDRQHEIPVFVNTIFTIMCVVCHDAVTFDASCSTCVLVTCVCVEKVAKKAPHAARDSYLCQHHLQD